MGWFEEQIQDAIRDTLTAIKDALLGFTNEVFRAILRPIVGVPAPQSNEQYVVAGTPDNQPWQDLYADFYIQYILPLTIMLLIVGLAYIGVRAGSISQYRRKRLLRRIGIVFFGSFVWFPLVSLPLQFVNAIGVTLAPINDMTTDFGALIESSVGGLFVVLAIALLATTLLLVAAFVYALRWLAILVLTPLMPLLGVFWAFDVWPLSPASELARRAASLYPGLILSGLPAAVLFRVGWQLDITASASGLFSLFLGLALIPAACLASLLTVYWSSPAIKTIARGSVAKPNPRTAAASTKHGVGATVRGARNVHRGLSENAPGALTQDGRTLGDGGSRAYQLGAGVKATKTHAKQYQNLHHSETGRMRDKAREDASHAAAIAKARSKQAFQNTKQTISRW